MVVGTVTGGVHCFSFISVGSLISHSYFPLFLHFLSPRGTPSFILSYSPPESQLPWGSLVRFCMFSSLDYELPSPDLCSVFLYLLSHLLCLRVVLSRFPVGPLWSSLLFVTKSFLPLHPHPLHPQACSALFKFSCLFAFPSYRELESSCFLFPRNAEGRGPVCFIGPPCWFFFRRVIGSFKISMPLLCSKPQNPSVMTVLKVKKLKTNTYIYPEVFKKS